MAGREYTDSGPGNWVRLTGPRSTHEILQEERSFADGSTPQLLDIVSVPVREERPKPHQAENHIIDTQHRWIHAGRIGFHDLPACCDAPEQLWTLGSSSSSGVNDRVEHGYRDGTSLYLIHLDTLTLQKDTAAASSGQGSTVRAEFCYKDITYRLVVTDSIFRSAVLRKSDGGIYSISNVYVGISLGKLFWGWHYKLIAGIHHRG